MKATTLLKNDHTKVKGIFREYQSTGERAYKARVQLFEKMKKELEVHSAIEEEIFYPAVRAARTKKAEEIIEEAVEEHAEAKQLLEEISTLRPEQDEFDSKVSDLIKAVKHHASEEEDEMFPQAEKHLSQNELEELGQRMEERKTQLTGSKRFKARGMAETRA
jgi:iron-sulfur cluster repair protein YtfE (RIC family)